jgi:hypothetical protein
MNKGSAAFFGLFSECDFLARKHAVLPRTRINKGSVGIHRSEFRRVCATKMKSPAGKETNSPKFFGQKSGASHVAPTRMNKGCAGDWPSFTRGGFEKFFEKLSKNR